MPSNGVAPTTYGPISEALDERWPWPWDGPGLKPVDATTQSLTTLGPVAYMTSQMAPRGIPWREWRQSDNVEDHRGDAGANLLKMNMQQNELTNMIKSLQGDGTR